MILGSEIAFALAVAGAGVDQLAIAVETEIADDVLGPAEPVACGLEPPLLRKNAVAAALRGQPQEIGFVAEQPKPVLHLPLDVKIAGAGELGKSLIARREAEDKSDTEGEKEEESAHDRGW